MIFFFLGFLTIGIPSIKRDNGVEYLFDTVRSLISETSIKDKTETVVVIFLADFDADYNKHVVKALTEKFTLHINTGFIQILQASSDFYPQLEGLKRNFKDTRERVSWRAKQIIDFSYLFLYSQNISEYYIQLEDDVICAPKFVPKIKAFIKAQKKPWGVLDFSSLGFIGKLFKSADLKKLAIFLLTFYDEQPVDWLLPLFRSAMAQKRTIMCRPTLFQHIGTMSSFDTSKPNELKDKYYNVPTNSLSTHLMSLMSMNKP